MGSKFMIFHLLSVFVMQHWQIFLNFMYVFHFLILQYISHISHIMPFE